MNTYIHYGNKYFDKNKFDEIQNDGWNKPVGGLWASRVDAKFGWEHWNEEQQFRPCLEENSFKFKLKEDTRILVIDNIEILESLPKLKGMDEWSSTITFLDFEELIKEYDAMELLISECGALYQIMYGWDCDTMLVFNSDKIIELER